MSNWKGKFGPLLIAEIGGNHEGNFEYAVNLTKLAVASGVDYVKYQIYSGDGLVNSLESPDRNNHFKKFELTKDQHIQLAEICKENNVGYMASVWDDDVLDWIDHYMQIYKIGSGDLTAYPMIRQIAQKGKPIILSTGLSSESEVVETIKYIQSINNLYKSSENLAILQCTSMYPIPPADANLSIMHRLKEITGLAVGYSDHTIGSYALEVAYTMGAQVLEFHFTDTREGKSFRDHKVSLTSSEIKELITKIAVIDELKGSNIKKPLAVEGDHLTSFRRALYPSSDISQGAIIGISDLVSLRPNHGIDAREVDKLVGKKANRPLAKHQKLEWSYFD